MNHTDECERARAGHFRYWRDQWGDKHVTDEPDPYPTMADLSAEMQQAVLACSHKDHDVVRLFWGVGV